MIVEMQIEGALSFSPAAVIQAEKHLICLLYGALGTI